MLQRSKDYGLLAIFLWTMYQLIFGVVPATSMVATASLLSLQAKVTQSAITQVEPRQPYEGYCDVNQDDTKICKSTHD